LDYKILISDFRIHYLNGQIEVELVLPIAFKEQEILFNTLKEQCNIIKSKEKRINNILLFFKYNEG
jgi:hypothetical protein